MTDTTPTDAAPAIGHNRPPLNLAGALDAEQLLSDLRADSAEFEKRSAELMAGFQRFDAATQSGVTDDDTAGRAGAFVRQLDEHTRAIDARRVVVKEPVLTASRTIDGFYKSLGAPILDVRARVMKKLDDFMRRRREAEAARQREEAARQRAEAERLAAEAERQGNDALLDRALDMEAAASAAPAPVAPPPIRSDHGTTLSTRRGPWRVRIVDPDRVPRAYLMPNEPMLLALAKTDPRISEGAQPVAGVEFYREEKALVR